MFPFVGPLLLMACLGASEGGMAPDYEERLINWALELNQRELEPSPAHKRIEEVLVAQENVIAPSDPFPNLLNAIHWRTRETVIRRELLLAQGDLFDAQRLEESERILRRLFVLAVARVVPVKGHHGGIALLVVTKDRWSFRLSNSFTLIGSLLQFLQLQLIEVNFNGWAQQIAVNTTVRLDTISFGQLFVEPRLFGRRVTFSESASVIINRSSGKPEGTWGNFAVGRPLATLDQLWGAVVNASWNFRRRRIFRGAEVWQVAPADGSSDGAIPYIYDVAEVAGEASVTRRFGRAIKVEVTGAEGAYQRYYAAPPETALSREQAHWFQANYLPRSESVAYLSGFLRAFPADFRVLKDFETYQLSEDFHLGWLAQAGARVGMPLVPSNGPFVEVGASLRYRLLYGGDLFTATMAAGARLRPNEAAANQRLAAEVLNYTPLFWGGRLVTRILVDFKFNDLDNRRLLLGGSTGLRGTFPEEFAGRHQVLANVEFRARPFEILTTWLGLVLFYDVGSAFDEAPTLTHTTGIGLRVLIPQLNREVLRFDFGMVIGGPHPGVDRLNASWGQVTAIRPDFLDDPL